MMLFYSQQLRRIEIATGVVYSNAKRSRVNLNLTVKTVVFYVLVVSIEKAVKSLDFDGIWNLVARSSVLDVPKTTPALVTSSHLASVAQLESEFVIESRIYYSVKIS